MHAPFLEQLRHCRGFMRITTATVALAFLSLVTAPTAAAIRTAPSQPPGQQISAERQFAAAVRQTEATLARLEERLAHSHPHDNERAELARLRADLRQLTRAVRDGFERMGRHIEDKRLPELIVERHEKAVSEFERHRAALGADLEAIATADDRAGLREAVARLQERLDGVKLERAHQPFDPEGPLPHHRRQPSEQNTPKTHSDEFLSAGLSSNPLPRLAAAGEFVFDGVPGATDPAYLDETTEIRLTAAIQQKAAELEHDPVRIYHWVRNNVEWIPSWGAVQNAEDTLSSAKGNAMDIASLTIALLRASGIPARYVHGTIDVPEGAFRNWAGGFDDVHAAINYANSGGIPTTGIISGGRIEQVRMEHVWVEAALDYLPSRAAVNRVADSWVAMGPSFKQYEYQAGLDVSEIAGLDGEALAQSFLDSGSVNEAEGWIQGLDAGVLEHAQADAQAALEAHIADMSDPTVGEVIGGRRVIVQEFPGVPSSLPNRIVVEGARYAQLPAQLQPKLTLGFYPDLFGYPAEQVSFPWAAVNNRKVTLSFTPATEADEEALASLLPEGEITDISELPQTIPSYLIEVVPEIRVEGEVQLTGRPMRLGEDLDFIFEVSDPVHGTSSYPSPVVAGSYLSIAVAGGSVSPKALRDVQARLENTQSKLESQDQALLAGLTRDDILGDMFHAGTLGYFAQYDTLAYLAGLSQDSHHQLSTSVGTYGYVPRVDYLFGFPRSIAPGGVEMDLDRVAFATSVDGRGSEAGFNFTFQVGALSSALEHAVPEQMFVTEENPGEAVSAVRALQKASAEGQRIYHITQANQDAALPHIRQNALTLQEIRSALAVGKEVIVHTDPISVPGWSGAGYVIFDPDTGAGAWKVGGGLNGAFLAFAIFVVAMVVAVALIASGSLWIGGVILAWEIFGFASWIHGMKSADSWDEFNRNITGAVLLGLLGLLPLASLGGAAAGGVQWFGLIFGAMVTNPFGWFG